MTASLSISAALQQAHFKNAPIGVRTLTTTLRELGDVDWSSAPAQSLLKAWLPEHALDKDTIITRLELLATAGAFPAAWQIQVKVSGIKESVPLARWLAAVLPKVNPSEALYGRQVYWIGEALARVPAENHVTLAMGLAGTALRRHRLDLVDLAQQCCPDVLHRAIFDSKGAARTWWTPTDTGFTFELALASGMDPLHRDAQGFPFWAHLKAPYDGHSTVSVADTVWSWANQHDPTGMAFVKREAYFDRLRKSSDPLSVWDRLTLRPDWLDLTDRHGDPAVWVAIQHDMALVHPWSDHLRPYADRLKGVTNANGQNLIVALLTNPSFGNTNGTRSSAFKGLIELGIYPKVNSAGEGIITGQSDIPGNAIFMDLIEGLKGYSNALWAGTPIRIAQAVIQVASSPKAFTGWRPLFQSLPQAVSPLWRGLGLIQAAADGNQVGFDELVQSGPIDFPETLPAGSFNTLISSALSGKLAGPLRACIRQARLAKAASIEPARSPRRPRA